jgi:MFS transporter, CP family, cyanate transporter
VRGLWRNLVAWLVTGFMGLQSLGFYATIAFLPTILTGAGISQSVAGLLATAAAVLTAGGLVGLMLAPASGAYLWIVLLGGSCDGSSSGTGNAWGPSTARWTGPAVTTRQCT